MSAFSAGNDCQDIVLGRVGDVYWVPAAICKRRPRSWVTLKKPGLGWSQKSPLVLGGPERHKTFCLQKQSCCQLLCSLLKVFVRHLCEPQCDCGVESLSKLTKDKTLNKVREIPKNPCNMLPGRWNNSTSISTPKRSG